MKRHKSRNYDYNRKPRGWRREGRLERWRTILTFVVGLGVAGTIVYLAIKK